MYLSVAMVQVTKPGSELHEWHKTRLQHLKEMFIGGGDEK